MELNNIITNFLQNNCSKLQEIYLDHEKDFYYEGTGIMLIEFNMEVQNVNVNYIPYDVAITEMDATTIQRLKNNKIFAECGYKTCECRTCDTRPKAVLFFLNSNGQNLLIEAEINKG